MVRQMYEIPDYIGRCYSYWRQHSRGAATSVTTIHFSRWKTLLFATLYYADRKNFLILFPVAALYAYKYYHQRQDEISLKRRNYYRVRNVRHPIAISNLLCVCNLTIKFCSTEIWYILTMMNRHNSMVPVSHCLFWFTSILSTVCLFYLCASMYVFKKKCISVRAGYVSE